MLFFRIFQHLVPDAIAWRLSKNKTLTAFFEGLTGAPSDARDFTDEVWGDIFPDTTREIEEWERQFGVFPAAGASPAQRIAAVDSEWKARGGQSPHYVQTVLQAAGFPLFVHDWWEEPAPEPAGPYVTRNPRDFTNDPLIGQYQCIGYEAGQPRTVANALQDQPVCSDHVPTQPQCNRWLQNDVFYLVNKDLTRTAPPPIPDDATKWPFFWYVGGETFPNTVQVLRSREQELERILLKLGPAHQWIVLLVEWVEDVDVFDQTFDATFE